MNTTTGPVQWGQCALCGGPLTTEHVCPPLYRHPQFKEMFSPPVLDENVIRRVVREELERAFPRWISVDEYLPVEGRYIIVCGVNGMNFAYAKYTNFEAGVKTRWFARDINAEIFFITHWMHLPEPRTVSP